MTDRLPTAVGFIGLGVMGYPMVLNLLKKLPPSSRINVYDVIEDALARIKAEGGDTIVVCAHAAEVASKSVITRTLPFVIL